MLALTISISNLEGVKCMPLQHFNEKEVTESRPAPKIKEGAPTRVMLRELTILNPGESRNQKKILPDMDKIGGDAPMTRWKVNLMEYKRTIHPKIMMNGLNKNRGREKPKHFQVP